MTQRSRKDFFLIAELCSIVCMFVCDILFIHLSIDKHLDSFHRLAVVNNTTVIMGGKRPLQDLLFSQAGLLS